MLTKPLSPDARGIIDGGIQADGQVGVEGGVGLAIGRLALRAGGEGHKSQRVLSALEEIACAYAHAQLQQRHVAEA